jgi:hypothetical protein
MSKNEPSALRRGSLGLVVANEVGDARVGHHQLDCGDAGRRRCAAGEALADDAAQYGR